MYNNIIVRGAFMTANGIEKQRDNAASPALPHLKVLRETWCTQQQVDQATDYLQAHNPALIRDLLQWEDMERFSEYFGAAFAILEFLAARGVDVPATQMGKVDLMCEISRRLCAANGFKDFPPRGHALGPGPDKLPPLIVLPVDPERARRGSLTQEMVDSILAETYQLRPEVWYALGEEQRSDMRLFASDAFMGALGSAMQGIPAEKINGWTQGELFHEGLSRLYKMCGIEE
jgi:hypothetical protein